MEKELNFTVSVCCQENAKEPVACLINPIEDTSLSCPYMCHIASVVQMKSTAFYKNPQHKSARQRHGETVSRAHALDLLI